MHDNPASSASRSAPDETHDLKAELAKLAQDETAEIKAGLAKLALNPAPEMHQRTGARLRNYFLTGLVVVGPVTITLYIAWYFINIIDAWVKPYIPKIYNPESYVPLPDPGRRPGVRHHRPHHDRSPHGQPDRSLADLGRRNDAGAHAHRAQRLPGPETDLRIGRDRVRPNQSFQKVALMEFPSKGIWSIVFITGDAAEQIATEVPGQDLISVFMPTGMLPPSGFVCFVPRKDVMPVKMTVEDAAKIIISAGMVNPETQSKLQDLAQRARNGPKAA
jgi:uncharacterized membrane protein